MPMEEVDVEISENGIVENINGELINNVNGTVAEGEGEGEGGESGSTFINEVATSCDNGGGMQQYVIKARKANSKLILQNMEEVLNSVKQKHRQKHRRKKEKKLRAQAMAEENLIDESSSEMELEKLPTAELDQSNVHKRENNQEHSISRIGDEKARKTSSKGRKKHSSKRNTKSESNQDKEVVENAKAASSSPKKSSQDLEVNNKKPKTNAFEVMMNARNKPIGSNSPGKDRNDSLNDGNGEKEDSLGTTNAKRKALLQEWSERKGATKRKLDEEARASYVDEQLELRAKRFKQMLVRGGGSSRDSEMGSTSTPNERKKNGTGKEKTVKRTNLNETPLGESEGNSINISNNISNSASSSSHLKQRKSNIANVVDEKDNLTASKVPKGKPQPAKRGRPKKQAKIDQNLQDSVDARNASVDVDTEEFLSKLSSPTKKRDSLLGYFPKVPSPKDEKAVSGVASKIESSSQITSSEGSSKKETTSKKAVRSEKRSSKTKKHLNDTQTNGKADKGSSKDVNGGGTMSPTKVCEVPIIETPGRPRRSCVGKARYDYDLEVSPTKCTSDNVDLTNDSSIIILEDSYASSDSMAMEPRSLTKIRPSTQPAKLAPLFTRSMPKPSPDPEILRARREFLKSGLPLEIRIEQERLRQLEQSCEESAAYFPKTSHVMQLNFDDLSFLERFRQGCGILNNYLKPLTSFESNNDQSSHCMSIRKLNGINLESKSIMLPLSTPEFMASNSTVENKREIIKEWKKKFENFPTFKCYNQLREKYRYFSAIDSEQDTEQVTESFVVTRTTRRSLENPSGQSKSHHNLGKSSGGGMRTEDEAKPPLMAPNGELLFTEKYKPMLFEQVLVNLKPITQLREFLASWSDDKNATANGCSRGGSQTFPLDDSMDFVCDSNSSSQQSVGCNSVVLLGPISSGKTNAVFALANEMNFNVLEINAGMKRNGKKLIQELQEATQSHQIGNESPTTTSVSRGSSKLQQRLLQMSLKKRNQHSSGSKSRGDSPSTRSINTDISQNSRKCLILIEDADILFDQMDAGFTDAIYTLAASSKRPVIVVATNPDCQHLQRLMSQNTIHFTLPNALSISKYLSVLSLIENCPMNFDDLISLYLYNEKDLRRTLHDLQFFIQSGGDRRPNHYTVQLKLEAEPTSAPRQSSPRSESSDQQAMNNNTDVKPYFASPTKRRISEDPVTAADNEESYCDTRNVIARKGGVPCEKETLYMHKMLFAFYTVDQNENWRIPFPVDFDLFYINVSDLLYCSQVLCQSQTRTRIEMVENEETLKSFIKISDNNDSGLEAVRLFYENISVATLLGTRECAFSSDDHNVSSSSSSTDRLLPNLSEHISHDLVERAIEVNLKAEPCPYNLFHTPENRISLSNNMCTTAVPSRRSRSLDYEPVLRAICRSEKQRATQEKRRSSRFYHYLRNGYTDSMTTNFSATQFDDACNIFSDPDVWNGIATTVTLE